jgi:pyruvate/2-oxoglutarate dehydrogenase complex dihydrolipoamide acyltransferase (E2) component
VATPVRMPPLGQTSDLLSLLAWRKKEGEAVQEGELLLEIETDKATLEVEASVSGTLLRIDCQEGETVTAGAILGWLGEPGEQIVVQEQPPAGDEPVLVLPGVEHRAPPVRHDSVLATPAARMRARELGVDLSSVTGSGPDGRIERRDVDRAAGDGAG